MGNLVKPLEACGEPQASSRRQPEAGKEICITLKQAVWNSRASWRGLAWRSIIWRRAVCWWNAKCFCVKPTASGINIRRKAGFKYWQLGASKSAISSRVGVAAAPPWSFKWSKRNNDGGAGIMHTQASNRGVKWCVVLEARKRRKYRRLEIKRAKQLSTLINSKLIKGGLQHRRQSIVYYQCMRPGEAVQYALI